MEDLHALPIRRKKLDVDYGVLRVKNIEIRRPRVAADIIRQYTTGEGCEHLVALTMDKHLKAIDIRPLTVGTIDQVLASPRDIFQQVTAAQGAQHFIVGHNHPSRDLDPSESDLKLYKWLKISASLFAGIEFWDGLIVADGTKDYYSFTEDPLYEKWPALWKRDFDSLIEKHFES